MPVGGEAEMTLLKSGPIRLTGESEFDRCVAKTHEGQYAPAGRKAPEDMTCKECRQWDRENKRKVRFKGDHAICLKAAGQVGFKPSPFPADAIACRHFEPYQGQGGPRRRDDVAHQDLFGNAPRAARN